MPNITPNEIHALALIAGLDIADDRAEAIAPRLQAVLDADISDEQILERLLALNLERAKEED